MIIKWFTYNMRIKYSPFYQLSITHIIQNMTLALSQGQGQPIMRGPVPCLSTLHLRFIQKPSVPYISKVILTSENHNLQKHRKSSLFTALKIKLEIEDI